MMLEYPTVYGLTIERFRLDPRRSIGVSTNPRSGNGRGDIGCRTRRAICVLGLASLPLVTGCSGVAQGKKSGDSDEGLAVNVTQVERIELRRAVDAVGTLAARDQAVVSAEVDGRVARLVVDMGDRVAAGAPLVVLDGERLRYRADEQRASLEQTRARLGARGESLPPAEQTPDVLSAAAQHAEAEQQLLRARRLAARSLVSAEELERAETQWKTARAAHEAAIAAERQMRAEVSAREAALRVATRDLQDAVVRAPFEGVVAERMVSEGQFVRAQAPVMRLVRVHPLRLTAEIPERFGPGVQVDQPMSLLTDAFPDKPVEGRITRISPDVNLKTRAFSIEAEVPNPDGALKPGTFARVHVATNRVDRAIVIPASAIQTRYGTSLVFIVRDNTLAGVEVKLGDRLGPRVEILDGLEPGVTIVADGVEGLSNGMRVTPRKATASGAERKGEGTRP
jgi:membrane fusion protein, multidrug efflux system